MMLRILSLIAAASLLVACGGGSEQTVDYSARKKGQVYYSYPADEYWRPTLAFVLMLVAIAPHIISSHGSSSSVAIISPVLSGSELISTV